MPVYTGEIKASCMMSLFAAQALLHQRGISYDVTLITDCPVLPTSRNALVDIFMKDPDATDLFFIDSDVGFNAPAVLNILHRPEEIVAGIYPLKRDIGGFPVQIKLVDGYAVEQDGLIEADFMPTGFMRIKRSAIEKMQAAYPELLYTESVVNVAGMDLKGAYDFFSMGIIGERFTTEDYAFCAKWTKIGGRLWVYPDVDFTHTGTKSWTGNYANYAHLLRVSPPVTIPVIGAKEAICRKQSKLKGRKCTSGAKTNSRGLSSQTSATHGNQKAGATIRPKSASRLKSPKCRTLHITKTTKKK